MRKSNDRLIRVTVACLSFVALLVFGYPLVDEGLRLRSDDRALAELQQEYETIRVRGQRLARIEETLKEKRTILTQACVTEARVPQIRDAIIGLVRQSGAKLRGLEIHDGQSRRWAIEGDDIQSRQLPDFGMESEFELQTHTLSLVADGPLASILQVSQGIDRKQWLMTIDSFELKPIQSEDKHISLSLQLTFYGLKETPLPADETFAFLSEATRY